MCHILVVDDSPAMRKMIIAALKPLKAHFTEAANGLDAIEKIALEQIDFITLDINMPDMHGLEFLAFIRQHPAYRHTPVVVITTRDDQASQEETRALGISAYIPKPFQPQELFETVQHILEHECTA